MTKPLSYPYAFGRLAAAMNGTAYQVYKKACELGIDQEKVYQLEDFVEAYLKNLEKETREKAAEEYEKYGV